MCVCAHKTVGVPSCYAGLQGLWNAGYNLLIFLNHFTDLPRSLCMKICLYLSVTRGYDNRFCHRLRKIDECQILRIVSKSYAMCKLPYIRKMEPIYSSRQTQKLSVTDREKYRIHVNVTEPVICVQILKPLMTHLTSLNPCEDLKDSAKNDAKIGKMCCA